MAPPDLVDLAAKNGCRYIGIMSQQWSDNPEGYPFWSLLTDVSLRRETALRLADNGISISLGDGIMVSPGEDVERHRAALDMYLELGAKRVNTVSFDPDRARSFDQFAKLAEMTQSLGLELTIEFMPMLTIKTLDDALALIGGIGRPHFKLLLDVLHFTRAGHRPEDIARVDPALFGYIQICDGPIVGDPDYMLEATRDRFIPGEGEMPVEEIIAALPPDLVVSMEVPLQRLARQGVPISERVRRVADASRTILQKLNPQD
jgi:sugar phosphate isomerase/epimerase